MEAAAAVRPVHLAMLVFLAFAWGSSFLFIELAVATIPAITVAAARTVVAAAVLALLAGVRGHSFAPLWRRPVVFVMLGLVSQALPYGAIAWGQERIDSGLAAILMASVPLFTLLQAHVFVPSDRMTPAKLAGIALGFVGVAVLIGPAALAGLGGHTLGQLAVLFGALCYAVTNVVAHRVTHTPPTVTTVGCMFGAAVLVVPASLLFDAPWTLQPSATSLAAVLALGVLSTAIGGWVFFRLIRMTRPSFVAVNNYIVPAVGVFWGVTLLGEALSWRAAGALLLILLGVALTTANRRPPAL